jgi:hypothetical protein
MALANRTPKSLLSDVRELILVARTQTAQVVNAGLTLLYWQIGCRIRTDILKEKRAEYGERIFHMLSGQLTEEFGRGYSERNLANMVRFAEVFPNGNILQSLIAKLGWTHFQRIIPLDDPLKRDFYAEMCRIENWSTRTLGKKIGSMLFERTALSKKPDKLIRQELAGLREEDKLTPDLIFRDPYILDFLRLQDVCGEKDVGARFCGRWRASSWNWAPGSALWRGKNGCRSTTRIIISTCCSITGSCAGWLRLT